MLRRQKHALSESTTPFACTLFSSFFFLLLFFVFLCFSLILLEEKGKRLQFTAKMGNFTPTPSAPTP